MHCLSEWRNPVKQTVKYCVDCAVHLHWLLALQAPEARGFYLGLKDRITRNYLDYNKCRILWSHDNYEKVGCLTVMTVKVRLVQSA